MLRKLDVRPSHVPGSRSAAGSKPCDFVVTHSVTSEEIPIHTHSDYAVSYIFRGLCRCALEARKYMEFVPGEIGLLNPGQLTRIWLRHTSGTMSRSFLVRSSFSIC